MPDNFGIMPSFNVAFSSSGRVLKQGVNKLQALSSKSNINEISAPTRAEAKNPAYSIPDEIQIGIGKKPQKRPPPKLVKSLR
jgi:hypothetical protein